MKEATTVEEVRKHFAEHPDEPVKCVPRKSIKKVCNSLEEAEAVFDYMSKPAPNTCEICLYFHCSLCLKEKPAGVSPQEWGRNEVGWTPHGIQIWCRRHDCNVCHIDFEGQQHTANETIHQRDDLGV